MKKELFAGVLLLVLIGLCAWNLRYLSRMCTQLDEAVAQAVRELRRRRQAAPPETRRARARRCARRLRAGAKPRTMPTVCSRTRAQTP